MRERESIYSTVKTREQWMISLWENIDDKKRGKFFFLEVKRRVEKRKSVFFVL